ncbi:conserved exported hypothetical protein [Candidatus Sulfopaludibacter sp. SbA4]|nr:conserved exported hypothetical protein [Candidatus Sulfopaludibacter sp. SbA4]
MMWRNSVVAICLLGAASGLHAQFVEQAKVVPSGLMSIYSPSVGTSVALSSDGSTAIVGAMFFDDNSFTSSIVGAAWVYTRANGVWTQQSGALTGADASSFYESLQGSAVALSADGNTAIVGGMEDGGGQTFGDPNPTGAVWVYTRRSGVWSQQGSKLVPSDVVPGTITDLYFGAGADFGATAAVSADGNTLVAGGWGDNGGDGAAWVFTRDSNGRWSQQGNKLVGANTSMANQGWSVGISADGNTLIEGAPSDFCPVSPANCIGAAWIFTRSGGVWSQQVKLVGTGNAGANPNEGWSVAISGDGNTAAITGPFDNNSQGAIWIFTRSGSTWSQQGGKLTVTGATASPGLGLNNVSLSLPMATPSW